MDKSNRLLICALVMAISLCSLLLGNTGCRHEVKQGYQKISVTKQGFHFSFECPVSYEDPNSTVIGSAENTVQSGSVRLLRYMIKAQVMYIDTRLSIEISDKNSPYSSANERIEALLKGQSDLGDVSQFQLLERSQIKISGIISEVAIYNAKIAPEVVVGYSKAIARVATFDYKEHIWEIWQDANSDLADLTQVEWEHIINSFHID
jgi:hypothetical protein